MKTLLSEGKKETGGKNQFDPISNVLYLQQCKFL